MTGKGPLNEVCFSRRIHTLATAKRTRKPKSESVAKTKAAPVAKVSTSVVDISEAIRRRAYELFEQRGCAHGNDWQDWLQAEFEMKSRFGAA